MNPQPHHYGGGQDPAPGPRSKAFDMASFILALATVIGLFACGSVAALAVGCAVGKYAGLPPGGIGAAFMATWSCGLGVLFSARRGEL